MTDIRKCAQAVIDLIDRMPNGVDCDEYDATVDALRQALASEPSVDAYSIVLGDEKWQAFQDKLDRPVQDKPELANLLRGDVDALIADAVAKEREACAQIGEAFDKERPQSNYGRCIAVAIRARGQK